MKNRDSKSQKKKRILTKEDKTRRMIMTGLVLGLLLASLDQTVVGTSLPKIVADLGGLDRFSWLFSAYMLAATIMIPMAGKMSDRYGRKPIFLFGMLFFLGGSMLSGIAQDMNQLIIFRFLQGFGGGAMFPVATAVVADLYPPADRGKMQGLLGAVFAMSSIVGPFMGGWIVDNISWRWVFYVNLPVGVAAVAVTSVKFPSIPADRTKSVDYLGIAAITAALSSGLLMTFWGGTTYAWDSMVILGLGAISAIGVIAFIIIEMRAEDPILPFPLFRKSVFTLSCVCLMLIAFGLFGVIAFLPLFLQAVIGISATYSGEVLIPLMLTAMVGAIVSGVLLKRTGYKIWLLAGPLIAAVGLYLLSTLHRDSSSLDVVIYLIIAGLGLGFTMANYIVAAQNVIDRKTMGVATSTITLFRTLGATIGITILGVILNRRMTAELARNLPADAADYLPSTDVNTLGGLLLSSEADGLPEPIIEGIRLSLSNSITFIFLSSVFFLLAAWSLTLFIKSLPLKDREEYFEENKEESLNSQNLKSDEKPEAKLELELTDTNSK